MNLIPISVVTGANGFVGSHLVDYLLEKGHRVKCIVRKSSNLQWLKDKNVEIIDCGLWDKEKLAAAFNGSDYIFHVAGVVKSKNPEGYFKGNVESTRNLLDVVKENRIRLKKFLIVSSQTAVGPSSDDQPVNENSACKPITTYGKSKLEQEKTAMSYYPDIPITICRAPAVYGERDTEIFIYFQMFNKGITSIIGFDRKLVSLVHVHDLVEGLFLAATSEKSAGQIYFISSEKVYSWDEVGKVTSKVLNKKAVKIKIPHFLVFTIAAFAQFFSMFSSKPATLNIEKAKDLTRHAWTCDTSKAINQLGYRQKISIEDGIKRTCDWYIKMKWI